MPHERVLYESKDQQFILTSHRVRRQTITLGNAHIQSIMLEELASCLFVKHTYLRYLILAGLTFIIGSFSGFARENNLLIFISLLIAGFLIVIYFWDQEQFIDLVGYDTTIHLKAEGMDLAEIEHFIDYVEMAKNIRYLSR